MKYVLLLLVVSLVGTSGIAQSKKNVRETPSPTATPVSAPDTPAGSDSKKNGRPVDPVIKGVRQPSLAPTYFYEFSRPGFVYSEIKIEHANATKVDVLLEHRDGDAVLIIEDDGVGFDADRTMSSNGKKGSGGLGLVGMRERTALFGGTLEIETREGEGTAIFARIPVVPNGHGAARNPAKS